MVLLYGVTGDSSSLCEYERVEVVHMGTSTCILESIAGRITHVRHGGHELTNKALVELGIDREARARVHKDVDLSRQKLQLHWPSVKHWA